MEDDKDIMSGRAAREARVTRRMYGGQRWPNGVLEPLWHTGALVREGIDRNYLGMLLRSETREEWRIHTRPWPKRKQKR